MITRTERMIEKKRRWYYLKNNLACLYATFRLARNPQATKYVFMIGDTQDNIAESERRLGRYPDLFKSSPLEALWRSGYRPERYDLDKLGKLPPQTLGGAYARHMKGNELRVDYYPEKAAPRNGTQYLRQRMRQTHDIWHVLTGFGTDEFEEVGIQGFYAGQFVSSMSGLIGAGAILKSILRCRFDELREAHGLVLRGLLRRQARRIAARGEVGRAVGRELGQPAGAATASMCRAAARPRRSGRSRRWPSRSGRRQLPLLQVAIELAPGDGELVRKSAHQLRPPQAQLRVGEAVAARAKVSEPVGTDARR